MPTIAFDNFINVIANANNFESFCGAYLNPVDGSTVGGSVRGENFLPTLKPKAELRALSPVSPQQSEMFNQN